MTDKLTKEEKLAKIYEVIADKTLSAWCILEWKLWTDWWYKDYCRMVKEYWPWCRTVTQKWTYWGFVMTDWKDWEVKTPKTNERKIIWHTVMIWDVLDWIHENGMYIELYACWLLRMWPKEIYRSFLRKPIDDQSEECIDFVYSLLPTNH